MTASPIQDRRTYAQDEYGHVVLTKHLFFDPLPTLIDSGGLPIADGQQMS